MDSRQAPKRKLDVDRLLAGDRAEFEVLVEQESGRLFRVIMRVVGDEEEAKSVLQETFLQAYTRLGTFRGEARVTTWLYAIGINLARASLRKNRRYKTLSEEEFEALQPRFVGRMPAEMEVRWSPHKMAEANERKRLVHESIARLPDDYRVVLTLRDIEELSTADVARTLEISEGAVRVRLHRARQALKKLLTRHFGEGDEA